MWSSNVEQRVVQVGNVKVGGVPGKRSIALIGSIFYRGHKIWTDEERLEFDRGAAERLLKLQEELSDKTGNPSMVDVVISSAEAIPNLLDFAASKTAAPLLLDGVIRELRIAALDYVKTAGLQNRIVYNSLTPDYKQVELEAIKGAGVKSSILLAYYMRDFTSRGRVASIKNMLPAVAEAGITAPLVDTCVLDLPTLGQACLAIYQLKRETGVPVGCAAHNAVSLWKGLKPKLGPQAVKPCVASSIAMAASFGADLILYGPMEDAPYVFPAAAMADVALSQLVIERRDRPEQGHPRFKVG